MAERKREREAVKEGTGKDRKWPADKVERRRVSGLVPYARNARTHTDEQVAQIAASIKEWGWTTPVLIDEDGGIIAGHGRVLAAQKLGIPDIPVVVAKGWTTAQKAAYVLADNKLALNAEWDNDFLRVEMEGLRDLHFDLSLTGFSLTEIDAIENGWNAMLNPHERDGENLDGIATIIRVSVDADEGEQAAEVIKMALEAAGISHEIN